MGPMGRQRGKPASSLANPAIFPTGRVLRSQMEGSDRMPNLAVIGGQWGDEGKGKVVDLLAPHFDVVARFQGGPNAGHTVAFGGRTFFLHHIPSGIFREGITSVVGNGMVIDPESFLDEVRGLEDAGIPVRERLLISDRAHVILPLHKELDGAAEDRLGNDKIGTTRRGMGPVYTSKVSRYGIRTVDLAHHHRVVDRIGRALDSGLGSCLQTLGLPRPDPAEIAGLCERWAAEIGPLVTDTGQWLHERIAAGGRVLFEGAQGTLLDLDHGTYPHVTSSSTGAGGIATGLGIGPRRVNRVLGVMKAYCTRVGAGPFPTEEPGEVGDRIRETGREYGTTTGRPRRCGWFDAVAARYAARVNGLEGVAVTLFDVLDHFDEVRLATAYQVEREQVRHLPADPDLLQRARPVFETLPGWKTDTREARCLADLPTAARGYLDRMAEESGVPVDLVSVGPDRQEVVLDASSGLVSWLGS
jgi:adenylosuccinate synthase